MAQFLLYKRPAEVIPYTADFTDLLPSDTELDSTSKAQALDTADEDQTSFLVQSAIVTAGSKILTITLMNGLNGEDYTVYLNGVGATTKKLHSLILEVRVRSKIAGNL